MPRGTARGARTPAIIAVPRRGSASRVTVDVRGGNASARSGYSRPITIAAAASRSGPATSKSARRSRVRRSRTPSDTGSPGRCSVIARRGRWRAATIRGGSSSAATAIATAVNRRSRSIIVPLPVEASWTPPKDAEAARKHQARARRGGHRRTARQAPARRPESADPPGRVRLLPLRRRPPRPPSSVSRLQLVVAHVLARRCSSVAARRKAADSGSMASACRASTAARAGPRLAPSRRNAPRPAMTSCS